MSVRVAGPPRGAPRFDRRLLRRRARALLGELGLEDAELSLALVSDEQMAVLNERHRARRGPTDVLSFSLREGRHRAHAGALLGDVVIAPALASRQARARGHSLDEELLRLLIHGLLHLLGFDHAEPAEARSMRARERALRGVLA